MPRKLTIMLMPELMASIASAETQIVEDYYHSILSRDSALFRFILS